MFKKNFQFQGQKKTFMLKITLQDLVLSLIVVLEQKN